MKNRFVLVCASAVLAALFLSGCGVKYGNQKLADVTQENVGEFIVNGVTTKKDIIAKLGSTSQVSFMENGLEKWVYSFSKSTMKGVNFIPVVSLFTNGTDDITKTLTIIFDGDVVKTHTLGETQGETKGGIVG